MGYTLCHDTTCLSILRMIRGDCTVTSAHAQFAKAVVRLRVLNVSCACPDHTAHVSSLFWPGHLRRFCRNVLHREFDFLWQNSRLLNNGNIMGYFSDLNGNDKLYWPGGLGMNYSCACAVTGTCESDNFGCNCDIKDGQTRTDFGFVVVKEDLPIASLTFKEIGTGSSGSYYVGPLMCSERQFGNLRFDEHKKS